MGFIGALILDIILLKFFFLNFSSSSFLLQNFNEIGIVEVKKGYSLNDLFSFNFNSKYKEERLRRVWVKQLRIFFESYKDVILPIPRFSVGYKIDYGTLRGFHSMKDVIKAKPQMGFFSNLYSSLYTTNPLKRVQFDDNPLYDVIVREQLSLNLKKIAEQLNYELNTQYVYHRGNSGGATNFIVSTPLHNGVFLPLAAFYDVKYESAVSVEENVMFSSKKLLEKEAEQQCCNGNFDKFSLDYADAKHPFNVTILTYRFFYEFVKMDGGVMPYRIDTKLIAVPVPTNEIFLGDLKDDKKFETELKFFIEHTLPKLYYKTATNCPFTDHLLMADTYFISVLNCEYTTFETLAGVKLDNID